MKPIRSSVDNILRKSNTRELALTGLFVSLTAVGSQISIPLGPVPWTLQVFFVCLTGVFLPAKEAFFAQSLYLLLGLLGFPVFFKIWFGNSVSFWPYRRFLAHLSLDGVYNRESTKSCRFCGNLLFKPRPALSLRSSLVEFLLGKH